MSTGSSSPHRAGLVCAWASVLLASCASAPRALDAPRPWHWHGEAVTPAGIEEPSGVALVNGRLLIVGDDHAGTVFSCPLPQPGPDGRLTLDTHHLRSHELGGSLAADLEAVDVLADGRVVVLSERTAALADRDGWVARYDRAFHEVGGRGLEGLAVRSVNGGTSRVAALWEGGYPTPRDLPLATRGALADKALQPTVVVHDIEPGGRDLKLTAKNARKLALLDVPLPPGEEPQAQRFRAPALVWHDLGEKWGFIVLLSSGFGRPPAAGSEAVCPRDEADGRPRRYCYRVLQRFDQQGQRVGEPFDLDATFPDELTTANWEGMGWYEPGKSLVLVYDEASTDRRVIPQEALVIPLPEGW